MKVSTILIIAAVAASVIALTAFNLTQKAFYNKGDWRNRFYGMDYVAIKNVTDIELADAEKMQVTIEKGEKEGLYTKASFREHVKWSQNGNKLKFEVTEDAKKGAPFRNEDFVLVLNRIDHLKTSPYKPLKFQKSYPVAEVLIKGFNQNSLQLDLGKTSEVILEQVVLDSLVANIGNVEGGAGLTIEKDAKIKVADFTIPGASGLGLNNPNIVKATYNVSEQATVLLNGSALKILK